MDYVPPGPPPDDNPPPTNMKKHMIRIGFKDQAKSFMRVPRNKLHPTHINRLFNCNVELLLDQFSEAYYPEQWVWELKAKPFEYYIVNYLKTEVPVDPEDDPNYMGGAALYLENVPANIDRESLKAWLCKGMQANVTRIKKMREKVADAQSKLRNVQRQLKDVPFMQTDAATQKEAASERKTMAEFLTTELDMWDAKLKERKQKLSDVEQEFNEMEFTLEKYEKSKSANEWTWQLVLPPEKRKLAVKIVRMDDWPNYNLALGDAGGPGGIPEPLPPQVTYGRLEEFDPEYEARGLVANMRRVRVVRHRHGVGGLVQEDLVRVTPNFFYRGGWKHGVKHGEGKCTRHCWIYEGNHDEGRRYGPTGHFNFANGDVYEGNCLLTPQCAPSLHSGSKYGNSLWHGENGVYRFADGSVYEGAFKNGKPHGKGKYTDVNGDVQEGDFVDGLLDGYGDWTKADQIRYTGDFRKGIPHGKAKVTLPDGSYYEGDFEDGNMHGLVSGLKPDQAADQPSKEKAVIEARDARRLLGKSNPPTLPSWVVMEASEDEDPEWDDTKEEHEVPLSKHVARAYAHANRKPGRSRRALVAQKYWNGGKGHGTTWHFKGYYRDGYRQGLGTEWYGEKLKASKDRDSTEATYSDSLHGPWKQGRIQGLGLHVSAPHGPILWPVAYYSHKHRSNFDPVVYTDVHHRSVAQEALFVTSKREALKEFRRHRELQKKLEKRNIKHFERAVEEQRAVFFDEDIWKLMTEEERAEETRHQTFEKEKKGSSDMRVMLRKAGKI